MNKFIKWSFLAALSLFAGACKGTPAGEPSRLEVSAEELLFWPQASSKTVQVSGHPEFTATLADFLDRSWCGLEIVAGKTGNLVVSVTDNPEVRVERSAQIIVGATGMENKVITVRQTAPEPELSVKEKQVVVNENRRLDFSIEVTSNISVDFDLPAWITRQAGSVPATGNRTTYTFAATPITDGVTSREGVITVKAADPSLGNSVSVEIQQFTAGYSVGPLRIMSYNIRNGKGMDDRTDYGRIADVINGVQPDVAALQELDSVTTRSDRTDVLSVLASLTGMTATYCASIPFQGGKYGIGILSKKIPISTRRIPLPGSEEKRSCLMVEFDDYVFGCTHFSLTEADRLTSVEIIRQLALTVDKPLLLAGDINTLPSSSEMTLFKKDWQILNDIRQFTIPSNAPKYTIDYILGYTSGGFSYSVSQTRVLTGCLASDHLPVVADMQNIQLK